MTIGASSDTDTRDIAVIANTKVDQHLQDCAHFRLQLVRTMDDMRTDITSKANALGDDIRELSRQNARISWIVATIIGGLILVTKIPDLLTSFKMLHP